MWIESCPAIPSMEPFTCAELSKTFGKKISFDNNNIKNCKLTASFQDEELENIINVIAETFSLKIENTFDGIIFTGVGCGQ